MDKSAESVEKVWDKLAKEFRNWNGVKPRASWIRTGLSERASYNRLRVLEGGKQAKFYFDCTKRLSKKELSYLHSRAEINFEQAQAAARLATLFNLTIFIGAVVIFNQLFPGLIAKVTMGMLKSENSARLWVGALTAFCFFLTVIGVLSFSYGGTAQARDLKHLLELSLARRNLRGENSQKDDTSNMGTDLRNNFISDI